MIQTPSSPSRSSHSHTLTSPRLVRIQPEGHFVSLHGTFVLAHSWYISIRIPSWEARTSRKQVFNLTFKRTMTSFFTAPYFFPSSVPLPSITSYQAIMSKLNVLPLVSVPSKSVFSSGLIDFSKMPASLLILKCSLAVVRTRYRFLDLLFKAFIIWPQTVL